MSSLSRKPKPSGAARRMGGPSPGKDAKKKDAGGLGMGGGMGLGIGAGFSGMSISVKGTNPLPKKAPVNSTPEAKKRFEEAGASVSKGAKTSKTASSSSSPATGRATGRTKTTGTLKKGSLTTKKKAGGKGKKPSAEELAFQKKQAEAALVIQSSFRGFKQKKEFNELQRQHEEARKKREEVEKEMKELRKQAWLAEIERQRKLDAERRRKMQEEAKRRKEEVQLRKKLLEAAYDGEVEELEQLWPRAVEIFKDPVETADGHGTTLLSEAAAGGQLEGVKWLVAKGAYVLFSTHTHTLSLFR